MSWEMCWPFCLYENLLKVSFSWFAENMSLIWIFYLCYVHFPLVFIPHNVETNFEIVPFSTLPFVCCMSMLVGINSHRNRFLCCFEVHLIRYKARLAAPSCIKIILLFTKFQIFDAAIIRTCLGHTCLIFDGRLKILKFFLRKYVYTVLWIDNKMTQLNMPFLLLNCRI